MEDCCICFESLYGGHKLDCGHIFHESCIEQVKTDNCPLCRRPFKLETHIYILELTFLTKINKTTLFHFFPRLQKEIFNVINEAENIIVLYFQILERRDNWFQFFTEFQKEVTKCSKKDITIDIRAKILKYNG